MVISVGYLLAIDFFCHPISFLPISPPRSTCPTSNFLLCLQVRIVGGLFLSSQCYDSLFTHLLEINNRRKPPWILNHEFSRSPLCISVHVFDLGIGDAPIALSPEIVFSAVQINRSTRVIPTVNPRKQNLSDLISQMPWVWGLADACVGWSLSPGKVQSMFTNEESMTLVLHCGPLSSLVWMLTFHRWYPNINEEERKIIPFWVRLSGITLLYLSKVMARSVGDQLGPVTEVDFDEDANMVEFIRVQISWNVDWPLRFRKHFQFVPDDNTLGTQVLSWEVPYVFKTSIWKIQQRRLPDDHSESMPTSSIILISTKRQDTALFSTTSISQFKSKVMPKAFWSLSYKLLANIKYVQEGHNRLFHLLAWQRSARIAWLLSTLSSKLFQFPIFAYNGCIVLVLYFVNSL